MIDLSGRVVIVTGGNSGIARGVPRVGASVGIWSRREERNAEAVAELEGLGATAIGLQCDVTGEDNVAGAMRATLDRFGRLDCLVANAEGAHLTATPAVPRLHSGNCFTTSSASSAHTIPTLWKPGWNSPSAGTIR